MKILRSWDKHELKLSRMFLIRRPDGWAAVQPGEVPMPGEVVEIDGEKVVVERAEPSVGSCNWTPHVMILVAKT